MTRPDLLYPTPKSVLLFLKAVTGPYLVTILDSRFCCSYTVRLIQAADVEFTLQADRLYCRNEPN